MTNREIALSFKLLADLMEVHDENPFKYKVYANAYLLIKKLELNLTNLTVNELQAMAGVGKTVAEKIVELSETGKIQVLEEFKAKTPAGLIDILSIKGLGPKKVKTIWKELDVTEISELLLACNENRLVEVKGFGQKTQLDIISKIEFFYRNKGLYHYATVINSAEKLKLKVQNKYPTDKTEITGLLRRKMPVVQGIELITTLPEETFVEFYDLRNDEEETGNLFDNIPVFINHSKPNEFYKDIFKQSAASPFLDLFDAETFENASSEQEIFERNQTTFVIPEYRNDENNFKEAKNNQLPCFIENKDIKGIVHNHSKYSDGLNTIKEMADECKKQGFEYFVISDHSRSAGYANGLPIERVIQQWKEIDELNSKDVHFKIFKGIESDILNDGSLDYPDDILAGFEVVIASVHSNLKMDAEKATKRIITAIENPFTDILGHPTGRLLLGREGYPIDHKKVIEACAANDVVIELNANPQRLDLDWTWIRFATEKNVMISINPDAHSTGQIAFVHYGVNVARKAGLEAKMCLNCRSREEFEGWINKR